SILRFLRIPTRTVIGKNTLIDYNLDGGVDLMEDLTKSDEDFDTRNKKWILLDKNFIQLSLNSVVNNVEEKANLLENRLDGKKIYQNGDSYWVIHYWNEVFINGEWFI